MQLIAFCSLSFFSLFQSTHPHGVRLMLRAAARPNICVSIHAPTWGATSVSDLMSELVGTFQSTHPHGVRRSVRRPYQRSKSVSIHAPTWGATGECYNFANSAVVSIHAPTWGATPLNKFCTFANVFQSTHPHGVRLSGGIWVRPNI